MKSALITLFTLWLSPAIYGQTNDIVKSQGITSTLHQQNIGKIYFTSQHIPTSQIQQTNFLNNYTLTNKSDLFFVAFMNNSITNYLHQLDPHLPADSLVKVGNYQFSLWVDHKLIYASNLYPGAPNAKTQDTATIINKPLINNSNGNGLWSESFWNRFMYQGGDSALTEGRHLIRMEIRPYLDEGVVRLGGVIAAGELALLVNRKPSINISAIHLNKISPYHGLLVSKEKFNTNKIKELKGYIEAGVFKKISSIVVIKNGKILVEEYFNGETRNTLHDPRSVGKSLASTITGIALHDKYLHSEDQSLKEFYDLHAFNNYSLEKERVTIKDLLTMSSGFDGNDDDNNSPGNEENMYPTDDWVKFTLGLPIRRDVNPHDWHYFTAGVVLLGDILNRSVPGGLEKYAHTKLFQPIGIFRYKWQYTPQGVPNTAGGIQMTAFDFAKYGLLYKNNGRWHGKQLIPKSWVQKSFFRQKQIPGRTGEYYGYLFWNKSFRAKDKNYEAYYCAGNGGNYIVIFKDLPLVIVITATAYNQPYAHTQVNKIIQDYLLPAVIK